VELFPTPQQVLCLSVDSWQQQQGRQQQRAGSSTHCKCSNSSSKGLNKYCRLQSWTKQTCSHLVSCQLCQCLMHSNAPCRKVGYSTCSGNESSRASASSGE